VKAEGNYDSGWSENAEVSQEDGPIGLEEDQPAQDREKRFRLVKYFSSVSILLIFATCLALAAIMSGQAENIIYERVVEDTVMIMDNLNYQMYNHFLRPIYQERGEARLSEPEAYEFLDMVIQNTIHGFDISRVSLYDARVGMMVYSSDSKVPVVVYQEDPETGDREPMGKFADPMSAYREAIEKASQPPSAAVEAMAGGKAPRFWRPPGASGRAAYMSYLKERTVILRQNGGFLLWGFFPRGNFSISCFKAMEDYYSTDVSGVLQMTRDVTPEYREIASMQYAALAVAVGTSIFLTVVLRLVVARGEAIIHQKNAEKEALNERLNQAAHLVSLGRMVATVSHEIRNPLGIIKSTADFLNGSLKNEPKMAKLAGAIVDESDRLSLIVTDFLEFARPQEPRFSPVVPEEILEEIFVLLEVGMARAGVELRNELREEPGPLPADASLLHRAFMNLLINSIQAMPDGGLLTVRSELMADPRSGGYLDIEIIDTGPGLSGAAFENLFKPFYTTKTKGTGLGLVLVRNIIDAHSGKITFQNVKEEGPERGLKVALSLPLERRHERRESPRGSKKAWSI
jgi:signal transduction histidine kinase